MINKKEIDFCNNRIASLEEGIEACNEAITFYVNEIEYCRDRISYYRVTIKELENTNTKDEVVG